MTSRDIIFGFDRPRTVYERMVEGDKRKFTVNTSVFSTKNGVSLTSATWSVVEGHATVGADTESDDDSTAVVTATDVGSALIKIVLVFDDGQEGVQHIRINIRQIEEYRDRYGE